MPEAPSVNAIVALPFTLSLDAECLGVTTSARLGSLAIDVLLPEPRTDDDGRPFIGPPPTPGLRTDIDWSEQLSGYSPWGSVVSYSRNSPLSTGHAVDIYHLILRIKTAAPMTKNDAQQVADDLVLELKGWTHRLADWVELIRSIYLDRTTISSQQSIAMGSDLIIWQYDGTNGHRLSRGEVAGPVVTIGETGMTLDELRLALTLTDQKCDTPTGYAFLRDARGSVRDGFTRRAVLDSATAAEISLAKLLDSKTAFAGEAIGKAIRDSNRDLGRMTKTLRNTFNVPLRSDIQTGLANPRNQAIHAGVEPSISTANLALEIAAELVELATPYVSVTRL